MKILPILAVTAVAAGAAFAFSSTPAVDSTGSISVKVMWDGDVPEPAPDLKVGEKESAGCHSDPSHLDRTDRTLLIGDDKGIANVVVSISVKGAEVKPLADPLVVDQAGCRFEPHVAVAPMGSTIRFKNSDGVSHNVHSYSRKNDAVNKTISSGSQEDMVAKKDEVIKITCDVHPWMISYIVVTDATVYGVTDEHGAVSLDGLAPGEYVVSYWHESLGKGKSEKVTVAAGAAADLGIKLNASGSKGKGKGKGRGRKKRR